MLLLGKLANFSSHPGELVKADFSRHVEKVILRFLSTPIFPLPIVINLILLRMSLWKKLRSLVG
jgi:hypothetical protein